MRLLLTIRTLCGFIVILGITGCSIVAENHVVYQIGSVGESSLKFRRK
jgi:hypothetical protein